MRSGWISGQCSTSIQIANIQSYLNGVQIKDKICCLGSVELFTTFTNRSTLPVRVVNGPTSSGPNPARTRKYKPEPSPKPKTNFKPTSCPKKNGSYVMSENFCKVDMLFWLYFCTRKTKSTSEFRNKPDVLSTLGSNPVRTRPEPQTEKPGPTYNSAASNNIATVVSLKGCCASVQLCNLSFFCSVLAQNL